MHSVAGRRPHVRVMLIAAHRRSAASPRRYPTGPHRPSQQEKLRDSLATSESRRSSRPGARRAIAFAPPAFGRAPERALAMPPGRRKMRKERDSCRGGRSAEHPRRVTAASPVQAVLAIQWLWSLRRLWVAATSRHSDCAAALPLRMNRSIVPVVFDLPEHRLDRDLALGVELAAAVGGRACRASAR